MGPEEESRRRPLPWILINMGIALGLLLVVALTNSGVNDTEDDGSLFFLLGAALVFVFMGSLVMTRVPGHRIGWLLTAIGMGLIVSGLAGAMADRGLVVGGAIGGALWLTWFVLAGFLVLWFPTGRIPSPRWRWVEWLGWSLVAVVAVGYLFAERLCVEGDGSKCVVWVDNPIGIRGVPDPEHGWISVATLPLILGFVLLSALSLVIRFVRARGIERQQLKFLVLAVVVFVGSLLLSESGLPDWLNNALFAVAVLGLPLSIALAVLRYRLYDIDRIVSRTVSYTVVVGFLAAVYVGGLTGLTLLLPEQSQLVVAATTLAVAALFNPVRRRVQDWVDRRFNRSRYDTQRVMDRFAGSLRDQVNSEQVVDGWVGVVSETMQPASVAVWVREGHS